MKLRQLPAKVQPLLKSLQAPPRLVAHLTLVHDVACSLIESIDAAWTKLEYDRPAVMFGAATHDIGKAVRREELVGPGKDHEELGRSILKEAGFPDEYAALPGPMVAPNANLSRPSRICSSDWQTQSGKAFAIRN